MNDNFKYLKNLFYGIKSRKFIESKYYDSGAAGKMFEILINKQLDNKCAADFFEIELKVSSVNSKYPITLFSSFPKIYNKSFEDSIVYLISNYGYSCDNDVKKLSICVKSNKIKYCKSGYGFMLKVSYKWNKIYLCIFYKNKITCTKFYWSFEQLYKIFENKLKNPYLLIKAIEEGVIVINFNMILYGSNNIRYHGVNFAISYNNFHYIYEKIYK